MSSKERALEVETRLKPKRATGITNQSQGVFATLRGTWTAFRALLDTKARIVAYRIAPFFILREYYLPPWYERSLIAADEASWTKTWLHMNQRTHVNVQRSSVYRSIKRADSGVSLGSAIGHATGDTMTNAVDSGNGSGHGNGNGNGGKLPESATPRGLLHLLTNKKEQRWLENTSEPSKMESPQQSHRLFVSPPIPSTPLSTCSRTCPCTAITLTIYHPPHHISHTSILAA